MWIRLGLNGNRRGFLAGLGARVLGKEEATSWASLRDADDRWRSSRTVLRRVEMVARRQGFGCRTGTEMYAESGKGSQKVTTVIPTGSDQEIRIYLAREEAAGTGSLRT